MAGTDSLFDNDGDENDDSSTDSDQSETGESGDDKSSKSTDKRISDLQSARDKETARANKLQKQLEAIAAATKEEDVEAPKPTVGGDDSVQQMFRMMVFQQHPKLAEYGLTMDDLNGATPAEISASATELVARFSKLETQIRNKVLADNGMAPEIDAGTPPKVVRDFSTMSKEAFQKVMDEALNKSR